MIPRTFNDVRRIHNSKLIFPFTFKGTLMSMPIYGDMKEVSFQNRPFYPVVESPGVVFIVKKEDSSSAAQAVMEAVFQGWPVLLLTLIMAALSGIVIWALVGKSSTRPHNVVTTL